MLAIYFFFGMPENLLLNLNSSRNIEINKNWENVAQSGSVRLYKKRLYISLFLK